MASRITELVRTAPDWGREDALSAEVRDWLDRARQAVGELDPVEASIFEVHLQFLHNDIVRHGAEIIETLWRLERKIEKQEKTAVG